LSGLLLLAADDDVAIARAAVRDGEVLAVPGRPPITSRGEVPAGHKIALRDVPAGSPVTKLGHVIGVATGGIRAGEHVHVHNLGMPAAVDRPAGATTARVPPRPVLPAGARRTFLGFRRPGGAVGTRNYLGVLSTVNCSATVARHIARRTEDLVTAVHPGVIDGVVALTHGTGCGMACHGEGWDILRRTLRGYASHPNFGGLLVVGLGCEVNDLRSLVADLDVGPASAVDALTIQDTTGSAAATARGQGRLLAMAEEAGAATREEVGVEHLVLGLQCGGSDAWSALTANPALGVASDLLVAAGGTSVLGETPEIHGAERLLTGRAARPEVAEALLDRVAWWTAYASAHATTLDGNPSPGNHRGGITTILEKSLGAVAKAGRAPLEAVCGYAEPVPRPGLVFMDTPGYDPVSVTGMIAGGATLIGFTTGQGSVFGSRPAPTVKLVSNPATARRLADDTDLDCSGIVEDGTGVEELGRMVYDLLLDVASGQRTRSEELGLGGEEFVPWQIGAVL
jgi:altronate hydrolase